MFIYSYTSFMITVTIAFRGFFARIAQRSEVEITCMQPVCVADIVSDVAQTLRAGYRDFAYHAHISRNGLKLQNDTRLRDGDCIVFMAPVIGGG